MRRFMMVAVALVATAGSGLAFSGDGNRKFREILNGLKEAAAVVSTTGSGAFQAEINRDETEIDYELTFQDLEGDVRQAHIHIGHPQGSGGIVLWLCDSATNPSPSATTPDCTSNDPSNTHAGSVTGTLTAADVQVQAANGIAAGEFAEVVALIRAGKTYVNVHSTKFPPGEIRSQINRHDGNDDHQHGDRGR